MLEFYVFILFKKTDFNTVLAFLGGKVYRWWGVKIFVAEIGEGRSFVDADFLYIWDPPFQRKWLPPNTCEILSTRKVTHTHTMQLS